MFLIQKEGSAVIILKKNLLGSTQKDRDLLFHAKLVQQATAHFYAHVFKKINNCNDQILLSESVGKT